jgi:hypothetical protein
MSSFLEAQSPQVLAQPLLQLQALLKRSFLRQLLAWQLFWSLEQAWHQGRQREVF